MSQSEKRQSANLNTRAILGGLKVMLVALLLAEILVIAIYSQLEPESLTRRTTLSAIITCLVSFPIGYYIQLQNQQLVSLTKKLALMANTDQLTGLENRSSFLHSVEQQLNTPPSGPTAGSFLFIDIDHFKSINDEFGHVAGDKALRKVAKVIAEFKNDDVLVGRLGGEEFGVFARGANKKAAIAIAENIRRKVRKITIAGALDGRQLSVSIGVGMHHSAQSLSTLVSAADNCMYQAKENGRNCVVAEELNSEAVAETPVNDQQKIA